MRHSGSAEKHRSAFTNTSATAAGGATTGGQSYTLQACGSPTPTPTATPSCTPGGQITQSGATVNFGSPGRRDYSTSTLRQVQSSVTALKPIRGDGPFTDCRSLLLPGIRPRKGTKLIWPLPSGDRQRNRGGSIADSRDLIEPDPATGHTLHPRRGLPAQLTHPQHQLQ